MANAWFNQNPQVTPIPASGPWIYSGFTQTATLSNSSTAVTALSVGTTMLFVGQVVTGTGIVNNPPTTIAALGSATSGTLTLSQNTTASAAGTGITLTFQGVPGLQSAIFGNYGFYGIPAPNLTDVLGCPFAIPEAQTLLAGSTFIPAPGEGTMALTSGTTAMTIQFQTAASTWTTVFTGTVSATTYFTIATDGGNVRINCPTTNGSFIYYRYRGNNPIS